MDAATVTRPILLYLSRFLLGLELFLLLDFLLQHLLEPLVVLRFAEHAGALLRSYVPSQILIFLLLAESDPVRDQFQFILEFPSALPQLAESDRLEFFWEKELSVE